MYFSPEGMQCVHGAKNGICGEKDKGISSLSCSRNSHGRLLLSLVKHVLSSCFSGISSAWKKWGELKNRVGAKAGFGREEAGRGSMVQMASWSPAFIIPFHNRHLSRIYFSQPALQLAPLAIFPQWDSADMKVPPEVAKASRSPWASSRLLAPFAS